MDVCTLHVILSFDPTLHIDVRHLLSSEESIVFQDDIISVPDDTSQLITGEDKDLQRFNNSDPTYVSKAIECNRHSVSLRIST